MTEDTRLAEALAACKEDAARAFIKEKFDCGTELENSDLVFPVTGLIPYNTHDLRTCHIAC